MCDYAPELAALPLRRLFGECDDGEQRERRLDLLAGAPRGDTLFVFALP